MRIGQSDRRITVQRYTTSTNTYGERVQTYSTLITVWAELMKNGIGMTERIVTDQDMPVQRVKFKIRSSSASRGVKADDRVLYDSKLYNIQGIEEIGRDDQLVLLCQISGT
jgi:head-tail adaptor